MHQNQSRGRQLTALLKERDIGNIPGIVGRLGDLASINERYDVAISTACPQLDFIVVDDMDTAKKCVQLLKERNLGLATFLGLDKVRKSFFANIYRILNPKYYIVFPKLFEVASWSHEVILSIPFLRKLLELKE